MSSSLSSCLASFSAPGPVWLEFHDQCSGVYSRHFETLDADRFICPFVDWIKETSSITAAGVGSITFVLEGQGPEAQEIWTIIKHAAALEEAMAASEHCGQSRLNDLRGVFGPESTLNVSDFLFSFGPVPNPLPCPVEEQSLHFFKRLHLPSDLPESFPAAIRDIVNGIGNVRLNGDPGEIRDLDKLAQTQKTWTLQSFWDE
ncbi:hypothetical protein EJ04DRAFT_570612 [Polyplosphaeria fusca]|uniref:Uncharacterized protein n=1 Tax=Polyplosphaeria fusca TaxID=682080 RepID=A0A9P4QLP5_9PLEO|nr:hypothetical protein EJ04DRAFT_570612 [Polyplosphaeria fusca]